jgi:hypothetical protein
MKRGREERPVLTIINVNEKDRLLHNTVAALNTPRANYGPQTAEQTQFVLERVGEVMGVTSRAAFIASPVCQNAMRNIQTREKTHQSFNTQPSMADVMKSVTGMEKVHLKFMQYENDMHMVVQFVRDALFFNDTVDAETMKRANADHKALNTDSIPYLRVLDVVKLTDKERADLGCFWKALRSVREPGMPESAVARMAMFMSAMRRTSPIENTYETFTVGSFTDSLLAEIRKENS